MRPLTPTERALVDAIVKALPCAQRRSIEADLEKSQVEDVNGTGSSLVFTIDGYARPLSGQHAMPVEAELRDDDGAELSVTLYADKNDRLYELEIIRWGDGPIMKPDLSTLVTF